MTRRRYSFAALGGVLAIAATAVTGVAVAGPAAAAGSVATVTTTPTPVAVSLGDSFISGEGGRFAGSVYNNLGSDGESDTGPHNLGWDVYRDQNGNPISGERERCHRSVSAEINGAAKAFGQVPINLACSGATTRDILTDSRRGEKPQIQQLAAVAADKTKQIKTIAVSIGGNDLGFASILADCTQITNYHDCGTNGTYAKLEARRATVKANITSTLNAITTTMRNNGYADDSYKFVYQSGPDLFATSGSRYRSSSVFSWYKESPGVPMSDGTVDFAHNAIVPFIGKLMKDAATSADNKHLQFLDLENAFEGHQLSHTATEQITVPWVGKTKTPVASTAEWVVPINSNYMAGTIFDTERQQESYHPNKFGQDALTTCLVGALKTNASEVFCAGHGGQPPSAQTITTN